MTIKQATPEEEATLNGGTPSKDSQTETPSKGLPDWVTVPEGFSFPKNREVGFMRFRANLTDDRSKGDRCLILWSLSANDEAFALKRAQGESTRVLAELAKQMIRSYDGNRVDWSQGNYDMDRLWNELGGRCRQQLINYYTKTHTLSDEETADFFMNCIEVVTTGGLDSDITNGI